VDVTTGQRVAIKSESNQTKQIPTEVALYKILDGGCNNKYNFSIIIIITFMAVSSRAAADALLGKRGIS